MPSSQLVYTFLGIDAGAGAQFDKMAAKTDALSASNDKSLLSFKSLAAGAGVALGIVAAASVKAAVDFQTQMTRLNTQANVSKKNVAALSSGILNMAGSVATTPTVLAQAAYHIASIGQGSLSTSQQLNVLRIAAEGAKVGGADLTDVTNALDAALVSHIKGVHDYSQAMGVLNATVGAGDMTMQNLADAFGPLGPTFKGFGVTIQQAGAALAVFGDNNLRGAAAGTALRMSIQAMAEPIEGGAAILQGWGDQAGNLQKQLRQGGLTDALDHLDGLFIKNGISAKKFADEDTAIFGKRAGTGINTLLEELDRYHTKLGLISADAKQFGTDWQHYTKTFSYTFDSMQASVEALGIKIGDDLLPAVTAATRWIGTTGLDDVQAFFKAAAGNPEVQAIFSNLGKLIEVVGSSLENAQRALGPFEADLLRLGAGAALVGLEGITKALDVLGDGLNDVTGFFAHNEIAASALAGVLTAALLPKVVALADALAGLAAKGLVSVFTAAATGAATYTAAATAANTATEVLDADLDGLSVATAALDTTSEALTVTLGALDVSMSAVTAAARAEASSFAAVMAAAEAANAALVEMDAAATAADAALAFNPATLAAMAAVAAVVGGITLAQRKNNEEMQQGAAIANQYFRTLNTNYVSLAKTQQTQNDLTKKFGQEWQTVKANLLNSKDFGALEQTGKNLGSVTTNMSAMKTTVAALSKQFGISGSAIQKFALAQHINLTNTQKAAAAFQQAIGPTKQFAENNQVLKTAVAGSAAAIQALTNNVTLLLGGPLAEQQAISQFTSDLEAMAKAAKNNTGVVNASTVAGRANADMFQTMDTDIQASLSAWESAGRGADYIRTHLLALEKQTEATGIATTGNTAQTQAYLAKLNLLPSQINKLTGSLKGLTGTVKATGGAMKTAGDDVGAQVGLGMIQGIEKYQSLVGVKAAALANTALHAMRIAADVHSPSEKTAYIGQMLAEGLIQGFAGRTSQMEDQLSQSMQDVLNKLQSRISAIQAKMTAAVTAAQSKLTAALKAEASYQASLASSALQQSALSNVITSAAKTITNEYGQTVTTRPARLHSIRHFDVVQEAAQKHFYADIERLHKEGLSTAILSQIEQMGPQAGMADARQILSGADGSIKHLDRLQREIDKYAHRSAAVVGQQKYGRQVHHDRHRVAHRQRERHHTDHELKHEAKIYAHELAEELKPILTKTGSGKDVHMTFSGHFDGHFTHAQIVELETKLHRLHRTRGKK